MSVVIIGGHDRMVCQYKKICKDWKNEEKCINSEEKKLDDLIKTIEELRQEKQTKELEAKDEGEAVSYTHLTLPTIA